MKHKNYKINFRNVPSRFSGHGATKTMVIQNTKHPWRHFWDTLQFYLLLGFVPYICIATYANIFIGNAELQEIPEGYEPRHWEYYEHPLTRFLVKNCIPHIQKTYEKNLHGLAEEVDAGLMSKDIKIYTNIESLIDDYKTPYFVHVDPIGANLSYDILRKEEEKGFRVGR